jgi:ABC-type uncharacterized transport system YnjBCD permease subunit
MLVESIKRRVDDYYKVKSYYTSNKQGCNTEMDAAVRAVVISVAVMAIAYILLMILAVYYSFKCAKRNNWPFYIPLLLLSLTFIPNFGGYILILLVGYGMISCSF